MQLIRGLANLAPHHRAGVVTIGNFDGVHLGHQAVIRQVHAQARELGCHALVMLFEPQPQEFFQPALAPARLTRFGEKLTALMRCGVEAVLCLRFDARFASLSAQGFIAQVLVDALAVRHVVIGDDFRFGRNRQGDFALLKRVGEAQGFGVSPMASFVVDAARVSSTRVRQALAAGDFALAERLLGRPYDMQGRVIHGDKRGRTIGVPTINVPLRRRVSPLRGVYVVEVAGLQPDRVSGIANIGTRPTIDGARELLEVHLFDFAGEVYGRRVRVRFLHKLRDEQRFASFEELRRQIFLDIDHGRSWLHERGFSS